MIKKEEAERPDKTRLRLSSWAACWRYSFRLRIFEIVGAKTGNPPALTKNKRESTRIWSAIKREELFILRTWYLPFLWFHFDTRSAPERPFFRLSLSISLSLQTKKRKTYFHKKRERIRDDRKLRGFKKRKKNFQDLPRKKRVSEK